MSSDVLNTMVLTADGKEKSLNDFKGNVLLIVNVASRCGNTPQYAGLEKLYEKYKDQGLQVLGFPCNQFGGQEPGTMEEIQNFCTTNYGVTFPIFNKLEVKGPGQAPLYAKLTKTEPAGDISWNFEKFLVGKDGTVQARFTPRTKPEDPSVVSKIEQALKA
ncbi:MAG: glutathione peroxidase [Chloroflexi bacterium]|nr:glutathione peroxidase [Chloroflexota bacterium]MCL5273278.1 glutathione peroxidase [Chloroflexota bacterium]